MSNGKKKVEVYKMVLKNIQFLIGDILPKKIMRATAFKFFFVAIFLLVTSLHAGKTRHILLGPENFLAGIHDNTFVDTDGRLRLSYGFEEVLNISEEVIWDIYFENGLMLVAFGGQEGGLKVYSYNKSRKTIGKQIFSKSIPATEMMKITGDGRGNFYLGGGSKGEGKVFHFNQKSKDLKEIASLEVDFIWDLHYDGAQNHLYLATGSKKAQIYRIAFKNAKKVEGDPLLVASFDEPNVIKMVMEKDYLYVSTSQRGKLYRLSVSKKNIAQKPVVLYDAISKDVSDFFIDGDYIYLSTAGEKKEKDVLGISKKTKDAEMKGKKNNAVAKKGENEHSKQEHDSSKKVGVVNLSLAEKNMGKSIPKPPMGGVDKRKRNPAIKKAPFENNLVRIDKKTGIVNTLATFPSLNILSIGKLKALNTAYGNLPKEEIVLYVAFVKNGEIITFDTKTLESKLLHHDKKVGISAIRQREDGEIILSAVNGGSIYRLGRKMPNDGQFVSQIFNLGTVLRYGGIDVNSYGENEDLEIYVRSGSRSEWDDEWTDWVLAYSGAAAQPKISLENWEKIHRFVQFRIVLENKDNSSSEIGEMSFSYAMSNTPPVLYDFKLKHNKAPNRFPKNHPKALKSTLGKLGLLHKFFNMPNSSQYDLSWKIFDADNDLVRYHIYYREKSSNEWKSLIKNHYYSGLTFDSGLFMDGFYQLKVAYTDAPNNSPEDTFHREIISDYIVFDHNAPQLEIVQKNSLLKLTAVDELSPIVGVLYTFGDDAAYYELLPEDGVYDEIKENFSIVLPKDKEVITFIVREASNNFFKRNYRIKK